MAACTHCGVTLAAGARTCDRCGAPAPASWSDPREVPEPPPFDAPSGWVEHRDPWRGFRVYHPPRWRVLRREGLVLISPDGGRRYATLFWPMALRTPDEVQALASRFVQWKLQANPRLRAFVAPPGPAGETVLRVSEEGPQGPQGPLETQVQIRSDGRSALLVGIQAPRGCEPAALETLVRLGASFAPLPAMPRSLWVDPTEGAFSVEVPAGWSARGGTSRNNPFGLGASTFEAWGDPTGSVRVLLSGELVQFVDPGAGGGMMGTLASLFTGMPPMAMVAPGTRTAPFMTAEAYVRDFVLAERRTRDAGAGLLFGEDREDLVRELLGDLARRGMPGARVCVGDYLLRYQVSGVPLLEGGRVKTVMILQSGFFPGTPQPWMGEVPVVFHAPEARFAALAPVLEGVAASCKADPQWQAREQGRVNQQLAAGQADRARRQAEISRTLSETSDIITSGYWGRQSMTGHLSHDWSNAMLGYEDRVSSSGEIFSVPTGHDRVFRDNQGNFHGGGWLVNPDPTWQELRLV